MQHSVPLNKVYLKEINPVVSNKTRRLKESEETFMKVKKETKDIKGEKKVKKYVFE